MFTIISKVFSSYKIVGAIALITAIAIQEYRINSFRNEIREQQAEHQQEIIERSEMRYNRLESDFENYIDEVERLKQSQNRLQNNINTIERNATREAEQINNWNLDELIRRDILKAQQLIDEHQRSINDRMNR